MLEQMSTTVSIWKLQTVILRAVVPRAWKRTNSKLLPVKAVIGESAEKTDIEAGWFGILSSFVPQMKWHLKLQVASSSYTQCAK